MKKIITLFISIANIAAIGIAQTPGMVDESFQFGWFSNDPDNEEAIVNSEGIIYVFGRFDCYNHTSAHNLVRLNADMSVDNTFTPDPEIPDDADLILPLSAGGFIIYGILPEGDYNFTKVNNDGSIDAGFDTGTGAYSGDIWAGDDVRAIAEQTDGKILIAGKFNSFNGVSRKNIVRLNADGSVDLTFNPGSSTDKEIKSLAIQADGKILIGGLFKKYGGVTANYICRLSAAGDLDATFSPGAGPDKEVYTIAVQPDGKILAGGRFSNYSGNISKRIVRMLSDGSYDASFNTVTGANDVVRRILLQPDNKILIAGEFTKYKNTNCNRYTRLNADATVDAGFTNTPVPEKTYDYLDRICFTADGHILFDGVDAEENYRFLLLHSDGTLETSYYRENAIPYFTYFDREVSCLALDDKILIHDDLFRLNENGTSDESFNYAEVPYLGLKTVAQQADGKIIVAGYYSAYVDMNIQRINPDGSVDSTFYNGTNGDPEEIYVLRPQPDGKILAAGLDYSNNPTLMRYNTDGSVDATFPTGKFTYTETPASVLDFHLQADGKIIAGGQFNKYKTVLSRNIVRINADATRDAGFVTGSGFTEGSEVTKITITPDNKYLVLGTFTEYNGSTVNNLVRLNNNGSLDNTFILPAIFPAGFTVNAFELLTDGKLLVDIHDPVLVTNKLYRLNADLTIDPGFYVGSGHDSAIKKFFIQSTGNIIAQGTFTVYDGYCRRNFVRLYGDPAGCNYPSGLFADAITTSKATAHWNAVPDAIQYQISYRPVDAVAWQNKSATVNFKTLSGLIPNTIYEYKIRTECPAGYTDYSLLDNFTTLPFREGDITGMGMRVYPNPASDLLVVELNKAVENIQFEIFDITGNKINAYSFSGEDDLIRIDVSQLPEGIYLLQISDHSENKTLKFIHL